jgi:cytochrome oxidase Cu insertion factor (SCO1/SenC/PrrC family)
MRSPTRGEPAAEAFELMSGTMDPSSTGGTRNERVDRTAAFAAGPSGIPRKFVYVVLAAAAVLGIGGVLGEHVLDAAGVNPSATTVTTTVPSRAVAVASSNEHEAVVPGKLAAFMGLDRMTAGEARPFSLIDQRGDAVSLAGQRPRVVVMTFFDGRCNDICPVVAEEIEQADIDLKSSAGRVSFLTVNTDPAATAVSGLDNVLARTGLGRLPNWHMVTGPLSELDTVWGSYGIIVNFDTTTRAVEHNDVIYFLNGEGRFQLSATPFANEQRPSGTFALPKPEIDEFATGIATYARQLADGR